MSESASVEPPANPARPIESSRVLRAQLTLLGAALAFAALLLAWMYWKVQQGPHPLYKQGMAHIREKRWEEALAAFDAALERDDRHAPSWLNRAKVCAYLDKKQDAIDAYDRYLTLNAKIYGEEAYYWRGSLHRDLGQLEQAVSDFRAAYYNGKSSYKNSALFLWMESLIEIGEVDEAMVLMKVERKLKPNDGYRIAIYGYVRYFKGDVEGACADFVAAKAMTPESAGLAGYLGWKLARENKWLEAVPVLDTAIEIDADDYKNYWARSFSYWNLNRLEEARADWRKVMDLAPMELLASARPDWAKNLDPLALPMDRLPKQADLEDLEP